MSIKPLSTKVENSPEEAYYYMLGRVDDKVPVALHLRRKCERSISQSAQYSFNYAHDVLRGPFELGEVAMAKDPVTAMAYARHIKGRFQAFEEQLADYMVQILVMPVWRPRDRIHGINHSDLWDYIRLIDSMDVGQGILVRINLGIMIAWFG